MPTDLIIRKALPSEVETLADIGFAAWERDLMPFLHGPAANKQSERRRLSAAVHELLDRIIVAEIDGVPVGWCARQRGKAYIPYLFVTPQLQNHGIGSALLRRMESMLELQGADRVQLDTLADNVRAVNFYQHQGYQILVLKSEGKPGQQGSLSIRLEKRLQPFRGAITDAE
ncbi:MAG TPA: GNAT family N-acetyltransferase [Alphaproteobacteria bacterium]|nr:GNAT family N-acetyltransferase [Alphaproteobacteria bacterium]